jgi:hypothetical protein
MWFFTFMHAQQPQGISLCLGPVSMENWDHNMEFSTKAHHMDITITPLQCAVEQQPTWQNFTSPKAGLVLL